MVDNMTPKPQRTSLNILIALFSILTFLMLISYAIFLWEDPGRLILIFIPTCIILWALVGIKDNNLIVEKFSINISAGIAISLIAVILGIYFYVEYSSLSYERSANNNAADFILGFMAIAVLMLGTWKTTGRSIPIVVICFLAYAAFGNYLPFIFHHAGLSWKRILMISVLDLEGVFGSLPTLGFTTVIVFLFFAGMVQSFGGMEYITQLALKLLRKFKWGLPQISVITSMFFGLFSGSASANVAADGVFNIPLMKGCGIRPATAGAIETVASVGGQLMPPVMGVAAFIMADFLKVHYVEVIMMAIAPALLYYFFISFSIFINTRKLVANLDVSTCALPGNESSFRWSDGIPILISLIILMFLMEHLRMSVLLAGMIMIVAFLVARFLLDFISSRSYGSSFKYFLPKVMGGIVEGASMMVDIMFLLAIMGIISRVLISTGLAQKISFLMIDLAGGHLSLLLLLIFVASVLFGMAVSTVVAYLLVVMLAAPALLDFGIPLAVSHFIIFYLSLLSHITPPVAMSAAVASSIAGAPFLRTCWEAMKLGLPIFILPFLFIQKPDIVLANWNTPIAFVEIVLGFFPITYALQGEFKGIWGNLSRILLWGIPMVGLFYPRGIVSWICLLVGSLLTVYFIGKMKIPGDVPPSMRSSKT